jgi:hypothetical protein
MIKGAFLAVDDEAIISCPERELSLQFGDRFGGDCAQRRGSLELIESWPGTRAVILVISDC